METKICTKCLGKPQPMSQFSFRNKAKGIRAAMCKACIKQLTQQHYLNFTERYKDTNQRKRARNRQFLCTYLSDKCCSDCGNKDWRVLEFDHVRGTKIKSIADMVGYGFSVERILEEIAKCDIRCANCHRIRTLQVNGGRADQGLSDV